MLTATNPTYLEPCNEALSVNKNQFPTDFIWGVATSAFQIEGASKMDGKGPSIWDEFCQLPDVISDKSNGDVACDHYNRLESDVDLIASLNVNTYRFSIAWPRVQPTGEGAWNEAGFAFYERLIDGLIARGIKPYVTLNHWDLPAHLQHLGGWANRDTTARFVDYALEVHKRFGDRIASIATHNEPWVMATLGHELGTFAPGIKNRANAYQTAHHLLLSHGLAVRALRQAGAKYELGIVLNLSPIHPASNNPEDVAAATLEDGKLLRWYMDPLFKGHYPNDVWTFLGDDAPLMQAGDLEIISTPIDYLGINYYSRAVFDAKGAIDPVKQGKPVSDMGWEIYPEGLTELLLRIHTDYTVPPLFVTENGGAFKDVFENNRVHDADRTDYIIRHIAAVHNAMQQGVKMGGYMVWSLMDNFEWASGYEKRFGIVRVDYETQQRILKDSAKWYQGFLGEK